MTKEKISLNRTQIKYIAITAMLIDHTAALLLPPEKYPALTVLYVLMRTVGRIAGPVMFYFLAEGYRYTSSKLRYGIRLLSFGILSQIPYSLARYDEISLKSLNVIITLFLSYIMLILSERNKNQVTKGLTVFFFMLLSVFSDWGIFGPLMVWMFYVYHENRREQIRSYICICLIQIVISMIMIYQRKAEWYEGIYQIGTLGAIPLLDAYNGKTANTTKQNKYFYYCVYPVHLLLLWLMKLL